MKPALSFLFSAGHLLAITNAVLAQPSRALPVSEVNPPQHAPADKPQKVTVAAQVPVVAHVECPVFITLDPGETRVVTVRVACNEAWRFTLTTDNAAVRATNEQRSTAGGMAAAGHTFTISLTCAPSAAGPQRAGLVTRLTNGPRDTVTTWGEEKPQSSRI